MENKNTLHKNICDAFLHQQASDGYGDTYRDHVLEQYKLAIQGVDYTSKWKHIVNNYFLTIHTVLLTAIGLTAAREQLSMPAAAHQLIPLIGIFMAVTWWFTTRNYNSILEVKFSILHCIEDRLPLALYKTEWEIIKASSSGVRRAALIDGTVPLLFFLFYILVLFFVR